jgi:putative ABC transport system substrate-binding protein
MFVQVSTINSLVGSHVTQWRLSEVIGKFFIGVVIIALFAGCTNRQTPREPYVIGVIIWIKPMELVFDGVDAGLSEAGYIEGKDYRFVYDGPLGDLDTIQDSVQRYVAADVDAIISVSTPPTQIVKEITTGTDIPVIFGVTDPVASGLVDSLAHPGGNLTGVATGFATGRRLEWLVRVVPDIDEVFIPYNSNDGSAVAALADVQTMAASLNIQITSQPVSTAAEIAAALDTMPPSVDALFGLPDSLVALEQHQLIDFSLAKKLPYSAAGSNIVNSKTLLAYDFRFFDVGVQMSKLLVRTLEGADPSELPVESAEYYLSVNAHIANEIGLYIPDEILGAADYIFYE